MRTTIVTTLLLWSSLSMAAEQQIPRVPQIPDDARLDVVRDQLEGVVREVREAGLPDELIVNKVREGLAKNIAADRIALVAMGLGKQLGEAHAAITRQGRKSGSVGLYRALTEAEMAGWSTEETSRLIAAKIPEQAAIRALHAATDLLLRGYPKADSMALVHAIESKDDEGLQRLSLALERLRRAYAMSHLDAVVAIQRGLVSTTNLDDAVSQANSEAGKTGGGHSSGRSEKNNGNDSKGLGLGLGAGRGVATSRGKAKGKGR